MINDSLKKKLEDVFSKYDRSTINSYACYDCEKDLGDLKFNKEIKDSLPLRNDGKLIVICSDCADNEDY